MRKVCGKPRKESSRIQKEQKKHCTKEKRPQGGMGQMDKRTTLKRDEASSKGQGWRDWDLEQLESFCCLYFLWRCCDEDKDVTWLSEACKQGPKFDPQTLCREAGRSTQRNPVLNTYIYVVNMGWVWGSWLWWLVLIIPAPGRQRQIPRAQWLASLANEKTVTKDKVHCALVYLRCTSLTSTQTQYTQPPQASGCDTYYHIYVDM